MELPVCGICGIVRASPGELVDERCLVEMRDALEHRGPDEAGLFVDRNVGLAMRRLSIIDLRGGQQPQTNEAESIRVCCNGEICNYRADALPFDVLHAPKRGCALPLARWFRGDLAGFAEKRLLSAEARASGVYEPKCVASLLSDHRAGWTDSGGAMWTLLMFELWRSGSGALL